ncbi:MAG: hypothetical protein KKE30_18400, partial [Gammaproteobacteria bacterium]|nr:hypothetical protein [Gammaproteobacteria bacterium]
IFMWFLPTASAQSFQWQATEIIGATANQKQWIQNHLEFNYNAVSEDQISLQGAAACKRVKKQFGEHIQCEVVAYPDGNIHFVLNMQLDQVPTYVDLRKLTLIKPAAVSTEELTYCVFHCSDLSQRLQAWHNATATYRVEQLCEVSADLLFDRVEEITSDSASAVDNSVNSALNSALNRAVDSEGDVRNLANQYINHHLTQCLQVLDPEKLAAHLNRMLYRPFHTERNKSISTLSLLLPELSDCSVVRLRADWQWVADQSILPNVGGTARQLLQKSQIRECE